MQGGVGDREGEEGAGEGCARGHAREANGVLTCHCPLSHKRVWRGAAAAHVKRKMEIKKKSSVRRRCGAPRARHNRVVLQRQQDDESTVAGRERARPRADGVPLPTQAAVTDSLRERCVCVCV